MNTARYRRHGDAFPETRRQQTALIALGGESAPWTSRSCVMGAAAAGMPQLHCDCSGADGPGGHPLLETYDQVAAWINDQVQFDFVDPDSRMLIRRADRVASRCSNAWIVVHANQPFDAWNCLQSLVSAVHLPTLVTITGRGGFLVARFPQPAAAATWLKDIAGVRQVPSSEHLELNVAAAGVVLSEIMQGTTVAGDDLRVPRIVAFYSQHRPQRVKIQPGEPPADLVREIAMPPVPDTTYRGRRLILVGGGALGQWVSFAMALDRSISMAIHDGDRVIEEHNLARQILLIGHVGPHAKATVVADQLAAIDPDGLYTGHVHFIETPDDLGSLEADALVCLPDNDRARAIAASAAWEAGVPFAQAGTSAAGGQLTLHTDRCCLECTLGIRLADLPPRAETANSCAAAPDDSVVASNMVLAGLVVAELRRCLAGQKPVNLHFHGTGGGSNRLTSMIAMPSCPHRRQPVSP